MPRSYRPELRRQVIELARAGTRVAQLSVTFGMTETTIYNWLKQDRIDRGGRGRSHTGCRGLDAKRRVWVSRPMAPPPSRTLSRPCCSLRRSTNQRGLLA